MLKREYDSFYNSVRNWLFEKYTKFAVHRQYGATKPIGICNNTAFMEMKVLSFVKSANERRHPDSKLLIPSGINPNDFSMMISNIKNKLI